MPDGPLTFGRRLHELAAEHPGQTAVTHVDPQGGLAELTWAELDDRSNQVARLLLDAGVGPGRLVALVMGNVPEHLIAGLGVWKAGGGVLPLSPRLPAALLDPLLATAGADVVLRDLAAAARYPDGPVPDVLPRPGRAAATGGSTGAPKVVIDPAPWQARPGDFVAALGPRLGMRAGQVQLVAAGLYHLVPFVRSHYGLFEDQSLVLMERFDADLWLRLVEHRRVQFTFAVPTMLLRILRADGFERADLSSLQALTYGGGPCPAWLVRAWIDRVGPERIYESYGASEIAAWLSIRGDEWLAHPGSVGRAAAVEVRIKAADGALLKIGETGEVFLRDPARPGTPYLIAGGRGPDLDADGFVSVGDLGRLDADGYLYLSDRRSDLILSGGANVYPAEVEAALVAHPKVRDAAVIGLPDEEWGSRVHAIYEPADPAAPPTESELAAHLRGLLAPESLPRSYERVARLDRDEAGKIQRRRLADERARAGP